MGAGHLGLGPTRLNTSSSFGLLTLSSADAMYFIDHIHRTMCEIYSVSKKKRSLPHNLMDVHTKLGYGKVP